jgi:hypothetical protein
MSLKNQKKTRNAFSNNWEYQETPLIPHKIFALAFVQKRPRFWLFAPPLSTKAISVCSAKAACFVRSHLLGATAPHLVSAFPGP